MIDSRDRIETTFDPPIDRAYTSPVPPDVRTLVGALGAIALTVTLFGVGAALLALPAPAAVVAEGPAPIELA